MIRDPTQRTTEDDGKKTSRAYIYTLFDSSVIDSPRHFFELFREKEEIRYATGQLERGSVTNRKHLQLYVEFIKPVRGQRLFTLMGLPTGSGWFEFHL